MKNFKMGFTLAEVLVTLSIIGVVASLTTPTLIANYTKKTQETAIKKFVTQLEGAYQSYLADNRSDTLMEAGYNKGSGRQKFFEDHFKIETKCGADTNECFASSYSNINGTKKTFAETLGTWCAYAYTLKSGASFCFPLTTTMQTYSLIESSDDDLQDFIDNLTDNKIHRYENIYVDINGKKGPNIAGRDLFVLTLFEDGSIDEQKATPECRQDPNTTNCLGSASVSAARTNGSCINDENISPAGCLGRLLENNWKMNY